MLKNKNGISLIILVLIIVLVVIGVTAVVLVKNSDNSSNNDDTVNNSSTNNDNTNNGSNSSTGLNFSQTMKFMGYNIAYPSELDKYSFGNTDYGTCFEYNNLFVLLEAPSTAGVMLNITDIENAPSACEEYMFNTLEGRVRSLFNFDSTTQVIKKSSVMVQNGVEMLRVEGELKNTRKNTEVEFVGYYLMVETEPVYIMGIPMADATGSVKDFMDELASHITK